MRRHTRGQSSIEFLLLASAMLVGLAMMVIVAQGVLTNVVGDRQQASLAAVETAITREFEQADRAPPGYHRVFKLPTVINGEPYAIVILPDTEPRLDALIITWRNTTRLSFLHQNVTGTLTPGTNTIDRRTGVLVLN